MARQCAHLGMVWACFDENHRTTRVLAQSGGENATGGTSAVIRQGRLGPEILSVLSAGSDQDLSEMPEDRCEE
jgi:hypothetical protein